MSPNSEISTDKEKLFYEIIESKKYYEKLTKKTQIAFVCPKNIICSEGEKIL